jgi:hypothetical protein
MSRLLPRPRWSIFVVTPGTPAVPASWVTADEAYGGDPALRRFLEDQSLSYAPAVKCTEPLRPTAGTVSATAAQLAAEVPAEQWVGGLQRRPWRQGPTAVRLARIALAAPPASGLLARWLLVRPSRSDGELAFYACFGPAATSLVGLVGWPGSAGRSRRASRPAKARLA